VAGGGPCGYAAEAGAAVAAPWWPLILATKMVIVGTWSEFLPAAAREERNPNRDGEFGKSSRRDRVDCGDDATLFTVTAAAAAKNNEDHDHDGGAAMSKIPPAVRLRQRVAAAEQGCWNHVNHESRVTDRSRKA
jgi:hypothetical protein